MPKVRRQRPAMPPFPDDVYLRRPVPREAEPKAQSKMTRAEVLASARRVRTEPRKPLSVRARLVQLGGLLTIVLSLTMWLGGYADSVLVNAQSSMRANLVKAGFTVRYVDVRGATRTSAEEVSQALMVQAGDLIFDVDPTAARDAITELPMVHDATIVRMMPNRLVVIVDERMPVALWRGSEDTQLIDNRGEVIEGVDPGRYAELLTVVGEGAPSAARELVVALANAPQIADTVAQAERVSERRWDLVTGAGVRVQLPENTKAGVARLAALEAYEPVLRPDLELVDLRGESVVLRPRDVIAMREREV